MRVHLIGQSDLRMSTGGKHFAVSYGKVGIDIVKEESKWRATKRSNLK